MIVANTPRRRFRLVIELLEDLHTGCGTGFGVVDRALARDLAGRPVIPRSHLQGVWRDNADRLRNISEAGGLGLMDQDRLDTLFGATGGRRGCLIAPELKPVVDQGTATEGPASPAGLEWDATARRAGSRVPDDHSLRRTEYLPAGTILAGNGYLDTDDPALIAAFERVGLMTDRLGSERSRGSGLIRLIDCIWLEAESASGHGFATQGATGLRLLLRAAGPLCIPTIGFPGNIIPSETHIPGRMLAGALARYALDHGHRPDALFERCVLVGPAYPLPAGELPTKADALVALQVLPMPLCLYSPKPGAKEAGADEPSIWPHWAGQAGGGLDQGPGLVDKLLRQPATAETKGDDDLLDKTRVKRPKPNAYLFKAGGEDASWQVFAAPLGLRMRNKRGTSLADIDEKATALFTVEQVPAGTCFVADLHADAANVERLRQTLPGLLGTPGAPGILRVGRGGGPVELIAWSPLIPIPNHGQASGAGPKGTAKPDALRITLTTDALIRDPRTLAFHTQLSAEAVCDALGLDPPDLQANKQKRFSEGQRYAGFNAASGLPMAPKLAIRRGSTLRIEGPLAATLRHGLVGRRSIGDRQWEGCGRFLLDFAPAAQSIGAFAGPAQDGGRAGHLVDIARREDLLAAADRFAATTGMAAGLTRSQIGNLRDLVAALAQGASFDALSKELETYRDRVIRRRAGDKWQRLFVAGDQGLIATLKALCTDSKRVAEDADLFLRELRRRAKPDDDGSEGANESTHKSDVKEVAP